MTSLDNITPLLRERAELKQELDALKQKIEALELEIRPLLVGLGPVRVDDYTHEVVTMPGRKTLDKKAAAKDGVDLSKYEKVGAPFTQYKMKAVED